MTKKVHDNKNVVQEVNLVVPQFSYMILIGSIATTYKIMVIMIIMMIIIVITNIIIMMMMMIMLDYNLLFLSCWSLHISDIELLWFS